MQLRFDLFAYCRDELPLTGHALPGAGDRFLQHGSWVVYQFERCQLQPFVTAVGAKVLADQPDEARQFDVQYRGIDRLQIVLDPGLSFLEYSYDGRRNGFAYRLRFLVILQH